MDMTREQIDELWALGYRPWEIYTYNPDQVEYYGETREAGTISGWHIKHVFAKRDNLKTYPFFDAVIGISDVSTCEDIWGE